MSQSRHLGFPPAVNLAGEATRDVLLLLNPDAIPAPGCFEALRRPPASYAPGASSAARGRSRETRAVASSSARRLDGPSRSSHPTTLSPLPSQPH